MKKKSASIDRIKLELDTDAQGIFSEVFPDLERQLHKKAPGITINHVGVGEGTKDAVAVITATAALIVAATPVITAVFSKYFVDRGFNVELDAKSGKLKIWKENISAKAPSEPSPKPAKPHATK